MLNDLKILIEENESWLVKKILHYATIHNFVKYSSTLEEAWRLSIVGLSNSIISSIKLNKNIPDFGPDDSFENDPVSQFGLVEAQKHRSRGITLSMFLGLLKYYKQSYIDLINMQKHEQEIETFCRTYLERCFDRIEIAFCNEWTILENDVLVAELQKKNRELTIEKNSYLTLFESLSDPSIILNKQKEIININYSAAILLDPNIKPGGNYYQAANEQNYVNIKESKVLGKNILKVFPWLSSYLECGCSGTCFAELFVSNENKSRIFEISSSEMIDVTQRALGNIIMLRDVSVRKATEDALAVSEQRFRGAFETASHGMVLASIEGNYEEVNQAFLNIVAYKKEELLQMNFTDITYHEDIESDHMSMRDLLAGKQNSVTKYKRYVDKSGEKIWVHVSMSLSRDIKGNPLKIVAQIIDITEQLRAENKLKAMNEELEGRVIERTEQLKNANMKLETTLTKEMEYNDLQTRFINMISHEYRTPLTEIYSSVDLIRLYTQKANTQSVEKYLQKIQLSVNTLTALVENVCSYSNINKGSLDLHVQKFDVLTYTHSILKEIKQINNSSHNLIVQSDSSEIYMESDQNLFRQIILHIVGNAMKFSDDNSDIYISLKENRDNILVIVKDHGCGIKKEDIDSLFVPFYKSKQKIGIESGIGLGLPLVKKYLNLLQAKVTVESEINSGTIFTISFPPHLI